MSSYPFQLLIKLLTEFFGTFIFAIAVCFARQTLINTSVDASGNNLGFNIYLLYFLVWMAYTFAFEVSGAHFNAALTVLSMIRSGKRLPWYEGPLYIVVQFFGMIAGICMDWWYLRDPSSLRLYYFTKTKDNWIAEAVGMEIAAGAIFALVWLTQTDKITAVSPNKLWRSAAIGFTYVSTLYWSIDRTGGSNNPTYGLLQTFIGLWKTGYSIEMQYTWLYVVCPFVGAFLAWPFHEFIFKPAHKVSIDVEANKV
jgi:glycerol uptake facilitator-like aquaporin